MILQKQIANLKENPYLRNVVILMFGSGLSQLIPFTASLILARLFDAEDFGIFTLFSSIAAFLIVFASLRYEVPIMLPRRRSEAYRLAILSLLSAGIFALIILIVSILFSKSLAHFFNTPHIQPWLPLLALSVLFGSSISVLTQWINRQKEYRRLSGMMIQQSTTTATTNIGLGLAHFTQGGLIIGSLVGQGSTTLYYLKKFRKENRRFCRKLSWKQLKSTAIRYADYPKYNLPHRTVDMISITGIPIIIAYLFNEVVLGWYGFMFRVLKAPVGVLAGSIGQVYYQQLSENISQNKSVKSLFLKTISRLSLLIIPFFTLIYFFGPEIFGYIFGNQWVIAGSYASSMSPWLLVSSLSSPVSQTPVSFGKVKANFIFGLGNSLLLLSLMVALGIRGIEAALVFKYVGAIMPLYHLGLLFWYYQLIHNFEQQISKMKA